MKIVLLLYILLGICLCQWDYNLKAEQNNEVAQQFTHYVLERELPATICKDYNCQKQFLLNYDGKSFVYHGLWPGGSPQDQCFQPSGCVDMKYDASFNEDDVAAWLDEFFIGLYASTNGYRAHEFQKHGTCMMESNYMNQRQLQNFYFRTMAQVRQEYDLHTALETQGIVPNDNSFYTFDQISKALNSAFRGNYEAQMKCMFIEHEQYLGGVTLYLDTQFQLIEKPCKNQKQNLRNLKSKSGKGNQTLQPCTPIKPIIYPQFSMEKYL